MKYYRLSVSANLKVIGTFPQVNNGVFKTTWDAENSLLVVFKKKVISTDVEVPKLILNEKAKLTDLLSVSFVSLKLVVSEKLKKIIESANYDGVQFFKTSVITKGGTHEFWIMNPFGFRNHYIDFASSMIKCSDRNSSSFTKVKDAAAFDTLVEDGKRKEPRMICVISKESINNLEIKENFFLLEGVSGGFGYYVSENVKKKIEDESCTGIDFFEVSD